jgi:hypothetical protein
VIQEAPCSPSAMGAAQGRRSVVDSVSSHDNPTLSTLCLPFFNPQCNEATTPSAIHHLLLPAIPLSSAALSESSESQFTRRSAAVDISPDLIPFLIRRHPARGLRVPDGPSPPTRGRRPRSA